MEKRGRRRSQDFTNLRLKFIEHTGEGAGDGIPARPSVTLSMKRSTFQNSPSFTSHERGEVKKINFSRNITHIMAGRGGTLLASPSANSKRKWDQDERESEQKRHCGR